MVGKRFGVLLVLEPTSTDKNGRPRAGLRCRCDCGCEIIVRRSALVTKDVPRRQKSCGCGKGPNTSLVYFVQVVGGGPIKIGFARPQRMRARMSALQIGSPFELVLLGTLTGGATAERRLHNLFAAHRIRGEWFNPDRSILEFVEDCCDVLDRSLLGEATNA